MLKTISMGFKIKIEPLAKFDIQTEINFYNSKQKRLGKKFHTEIKEYFKAILQTPIFRCPLWWCALFTAQEISRDDSL